MDAAAPLPAVETAGGDSTEVFKNDPLIQKALKIFEGEIRSVRGPRLSAHRPFFTSTRNDSDLMNFNKMLKQAQKMQADAAKMQAELARKTVTASVGGGKVTVVATGGGDVVSIKISKDVVDPEDVEMLEDLVLSGVKQAIDEGKKMAESEMGKLTAGLGGMGLPGMGF